MTEDEIGDVDPIVGGVRWRSLTRSEYHVDPTHAVHPIKRERDGDPPHGQARHRGALPKRRSPADLTELHGIPEDSLSVSLREVLLELIDESGVLHDRLIDAENRIDFLEEHSRYDRLGDWLSPASMLGQIRHLADLDRREGIESSLAGIELPGYRATADAGSWSDAEAAMAKIGSVLMQVAPSGDVVGRLWDGTFGILLPGLTGEPAETLIADLASRCGDGQAVCTAIVALSPEEEPDRAVDRLYAMISGIRKDSR